MDTTVNENGSVGGCIEASQPGQHSTRKLVTEKSIDVSTYFAKREHFVRLFGMVLLVPFAPAILGCMLAVRLTSPGPALFCQKRLGKGDSSISILKIRTMYVDAEQLSGPQLCQPRDSRITPVGRVLRFLHLDELPQLINVARGEMCLVGPRPERPEIIEKHQLKERVPGFSERTKVLPGVTGLAQINLPADLSPECVIPKVKLDLEYIETACPGLDLRILLCTACRMLGIRHGHAAKFFGLCRKVSLGQKLPKERISSRLDHGFVETPNRLEQSPKGQLSFAVAGIEASEASEASEAEGQSKGTNADSNSLARNGTGRKVEDLTPRRPR